MPLKIISCLGLILFIPSLVYLIVLIIMSICTNYYLVLNYLFDIIILIGGINLLALGIIGEYISRIYDESKNRPIYLSNSIESNKE
jgi:positive regulator of sigma E activity